MKRRISDGVIVHGRRVSDVIIVPEGLAHKTGCRRKVVTYDVGLVLNVLAVVVGGQCDRVREVFAKLVADDALDAEGWRGEGNVRC